MTVERMSMENLDRLGVDEKGRLYWDDEIVHTGLGLSFWQNVGAFLVTVSAVIAAAGTVAQAYIAYLAYIKPT